jgi:hypothetical protein
MLIPIDFILYRGQENELRYLEFQGTYDSATGRIYNRNGSVPHLTFENAVVVSGERKRCPCCRNWLDRTPATDVLHLDGCFDLPPFFRPVLGRDFGL